MFILDSRIFDNKSQVIGQQVLREPWFQL